MTSDRFHRNDRASVATGIACFRGTKYSARRLARFHSVKEFRVRYLGLVHAANLQKALTLLRLKLIYFL